MVGVEVEVEVEVEVGVGVGVVVEVGMKINQLKADENLESRLKRSITLCKRIVENMDYIGMIKESLERDDLIMAEQLFHELDSDDQRILMAAPKFGGPFTTQERKTLRGMWKITANDLES